MSRDIIKEEFRQCSGEMRALTKEEFAAAAMEFGALLEKFTEDKGIGAVVVLITPAADSPSGGNYKGTVLSVAPQFFSEVVETLWKDLNRFSIHQNLHSRAN